MGKSKPITSSKTIRLGTVYISLGALVSILQAFDMLEIVLTSINAGDVPPNVAAGAGLILAVIGGLQVWLRMITSQPIGNEPPESEAGNAPLGGISVEDAIKELQSAVKLDVDNEAG